MIDGRLESHGRGLEEGGIKKVLCEHVKDSSEYHLQRCGWSSCSHRGKRTTAPQDDRMLQGKDTNEILMKSAVRSTSLSLSSLITSNGAWVDTKQWRTPRMRNSSKWAA